MSIPPPKLEILTPDEMAKLDAAAIAAGPFDGYRLMRNAGAAIAAHLLARWPGSAGVDILCGPGNNGGDGFVAARELARSGVDVALWQLAEPSSPDASRAWRDCPLEARSLDGFRPSPGRVVIDALFGAGLTRALTGAAAEATERCNAAGAAVLAVDLPSGVSGLTGRPLGPAFKAHATVTFARLKPGHLLQPGRALCGEVTLVDIGIRDDLVTAVRSRAFRNLPALWRDRLPRPAVDTHKYRRGHVLVASGGPSATGAARLVARGAARVGAGAVTLASPAKALAVNAAHLTAIMLARIDNAGDLGEFAARRKAAAFVIGPGFGIGERLRAMVEAWTRSGEGEARTLVLDADAITSFADDPSALFEREGTDDVVLTPHEGEFARLFPDLAVGEEPSKIERARKAARRARATLVYKGPDTVIAVPDGRVAVNENATPYLATAGSGDVLSGIVAGLAVQGMPTFEAAGAAVWLHAEAARRFGPGLIAEDLPELLPDVLDDLLDPPL